MKKSDSKILELRLYENGIDFINKSMESYQRAVNESQVNEFKYAILLLANGCELIFKSILEDKHPLFVKQNIDHLDDKTVSAENLIPRINKVYLEDKKMVQGKDKDIFESIRNMRNSIIHKEVLFDRNNDPSTMYAKTLYSLDRVVKQFKGKTLSKVVYMWDDVVNIPYIQKAYFSNVQGISIDGMSIPCALCSIEKLVYEGEKVKCLNCGHKYDSVIEAIQSLDDEDKKEYLFETFIYEKDQEGYQLFSCPNCFEDLAWYDDNNRTIKCFNCHTVKGDFCPNCKNHNVIYEDFELEDGLSGESKFCLSCDYTEGEYCSGCGSDEFLVNSVLIDIRRPGRFENEFPDIEKKESGAFYNVDVCPECISKFYTLEHKGILDLLNITRIKKDQKYDSLI